MVVPCDDSDKRLFQAATTIMVGDGAKTSFWHDHWLNGCCPKDIAPLCFRLAKRKQRCIQVEFSSNNRIVSFRQFMTVEEIWLCVWEAWFKIFSHLKVLMIFPGIGIHRVVTLVNLLTRINLQVLSLVFVLNPHGSFPQILTIWPFAKTNFTNNPRPKLILEMTLLFSAKSYGAKLRHLSVTSTYAECRATVDGRLSRRANMHLTPCYLTLRCLSSTPYDWHWTK